MSESARMGHNTHRVIDGGATRAIYFRSLAERIATVTDLWTKLRHANWVPANCIEMHRLVHNIRGSSGVAGFPAIAQAAEGLESQLERLLPEGNAPSMEHRDEIDSRLTVLAGKIRQLLLDKGDVEEVSAAIAMPEAPEREGRAGRSVRPLVYLVDDDPVQRTMLAAQVVQNGYDLRDFGSLLELERAVAAQAPTAIICDVVFPEGSLAGLDAIARLRTRETSRCPVIFISSRGDYAARFMALRSGGDAYLMKPVNIPALIGKLDELTADDSQDPYRVLIVDDDLIVSSFHSQILTLAGMKTQVIEGPDGIMQALMEFRPDLILMDLYLAECSGLELLGLIRQESAFVNVPVFFLSGESSKEKHLQALEEGADDFLIKPVDRDWLVSVVKSRVRRGRALGWRLRYMGTRDTVTGLFNRSHFLRRLEQTLWNPPKGQNGVLIVRLDRFADLRSVLGLGGLERLAADLARVLLSAADAEDLIGRIDEDTFVVLANRPHWGDVVTLAENLRRGFADCRVTGFGKPIKVTASIGVGLCQGDNAAGLLSEVEDAANRAEEEGGNRVRLLVSISRLQDDQEQQKVYLQQLVESAKAGRIHLFYQPIVSSNGDGLERYEVLLRISDADGLMLPTRNLLQAAQEAGLMRRIDTAVFREALAAAHKRMGRGRFASLFLKLSADSLEPAFFIEMIQQGLEKVGLPGETLVFMLPTSLVWKQIEQVKEIQTWLHQQGCSIGLENFGERAIDLQLLNQLEIDYVKFHPKLVQELSNGDAGFETLKVLIQQVEDHRARAIVAFIEDATTMTRVWQLGAQFIEGNFIQPAEMRMDFEFFSNVGGG